MRFLLICLLRSFASSAKSRIQWLEDVIRQHVPDFDLNSGPKVDVDHVDTAGQSPDSAMLGNNEMEGLGANVPPMHSTVTPHFERSEIKSSMKRSYSYAAESEKERQLSDEVRSVAVDLGMLSLNTDSRQSHYLGSSSGILFTRLIEADNTSRIETERNPEGENAFPVSGNRNRTISRGRPMKHTYHLLYDKFRKVCHSVFEEESSLF